MTRRQLLLCGAKLLFAAGVIAWLGRKVDLAHVWRNVGTAERLPVATGILLCLLTVGIAGWRWQRLLRIFQIQIGLKALIGITQIGQFFAVFLPGPLGDDLTRMLYISRLAPGRVGEACTTVLLDRSLGLATVLFLAVLCIPWYWTVLGTSKQTYLLALIILTAGGVICLFGLFFFLAGHPTHRWVSKRLLMVAARSLPDV